MDLVERCKQEITHRAGGVTETRQAETGLGESGGMSLSVLSLGLEDDSRL